MLAGNEIGMATSLAEARKQVKALKRALVEAKQLEGDSAANKKRVKAARKAWKAAKLSFDALKKKEKKGPAGDGGGDGDDNDKKKRKRSTGGDIGDKGDTAVLTSTASSVAGDGKDATADETEQPEAAATTTATTQPKKKKKKMRWRNRPQAYINQLPYTVTDDQLRSWITDNVALAQPPTKVDMLTMKNKKKKKKRTSAGQAFVTFASEDDLAKAIAALHGLLAGWLVGWLAGCMVGGSLTASNYFARAARNSCRTLCAYAPNCCHKTLLVCYSRVPYSNDVTNYRHLLPNEYIGVFATSPRGFNAFCR